MNRMMEEASTSVLRNEYVEYLADATKAVALTFVNDLDSLQTAKKYQPEFVYQHFGDNETIFGYKNLKVTLHYSDASMYIYPEITYTASILSDCKDLKSDDIMHKLREQLPAEQLDTISATVDSFKCRLKEQKNFRPFGELLSKFYSGEQEMQVWKVTESSPAFDAYLARVETISLWYIEAAQYTDTNDPRWQRYLVYESIRNSDGTNRVALVGYASIVKFYNYPDKIRPRIAQILLLPQYRGAGNGAKFLQAICRDLVKMPEVRDITAEDPAEKFILTRDYVDCCNCLKLIQFHPDNLKLGFTNEMKNTALQKLKINPRQARRVYEILRLYHIDARDENAVNEYRMDVKRRLEIPFKKNERDWRKLSQALEADELTAVMASQLNSEQKMNKLQQLYEEEIANYRKIIARIIAHPNLQ